MPPAGAAAASAAASCEGTGDEVAAAPLQGALGMIAAKRRTVQFMQKTGQYGQTSVTQYQMLRAMASQNHHTEAAVAPAANAVAYCITANC